MITNLKRTHKTCSGDYNELLLLKTFIETPIETQLSTIVYSNVSIPFIQELFVSKARLELQEADSHRSRLTSEVAALREEAKRNKVGAVVRGE